MWKSYVINLNSEDQRLYWHVPHTTENRLQQQRIAVVPAQMWKCGKATNNAVARTAV